MGVTPNTLTFGSVNTADYGIYITGEAAFNAPARVYDAYDVPGRNGQLLVDQGRFENIEVTYPAFIFDYQTANFAERMSQIRNAFLAQKGYVRLSDSYNTGEYREAVYGGGFEVEPQHFNQSGEFELTFNCKPQRFLTSGETATAIASGGKVNNPTLFDARPQLQVWGSGNITFNSKTITVQNVPYGSIQIVKPQSGNTVTFNNTNLFNTGDRITVMTPTRKSVSFTYQKHFTSNGVAVSKTSGAYDTTVATRVESVGSNYKVTFTLTWPDVVFVAGTSSTNTATYSFTITTTDNTTYTGTFSVSLAYSSSNNTLTLSSTATASNAGTTHNTGSYNEAWVNSTKSSLGDPMYIDLDIGEAYNMDSGEMVSVNNNVSIPPQLPVLPPGETTITYSNTFTSVKVVPRWWKV